MGGERLHLAEAVVKGAIDYRDSEQRIDRDPEGYMLAGAELDVRIDAWRQYIQSEASASEQS
jgi:hypothetical protein